MYSVLVQEACIRPTRTCITSNTPPAWPVQFARGHPETVLGMDLSLIQRADNPPNFPFTVANANDPWPAERRGKLDYVYTRSIGFGIRD